MALASGARLGPYEIAAQVGVGRMGEVYRIELVGNRSDTGWRS